MQCEVEDPSDLLQNSSADKEELPLTALRSLGFFVKVSDLSNNSGRFHYKVRKFSGCFFSHKTILLLNLRKC